MKEKPVKSGETYWSDLPSKTNWSLKKVRLSHAPTVVLKKCHELGALCSDYILKKYRLFQIQKIRMKTEGFIN
jgi:hypothetical protein